MELLPSPYFLFFLLLHPLLNSISEAKEYWSVSYLEPFVILVSLTPIYPFISSGRIILFSWSQVPIELFKVPQKASFTSFLSLSIGAQYTMKNSLLTFTFILSYKNLSSLIHLLDPLLGKHVIYYLLLITVWVCALTIHFLLFYCDIRK